jgi:hypothetical protein
MAVSILDLHQSVTDAMLDAVSHWLPSIHRHQS